MSKQPPFTITNKMIDEISLISELLGKLDANNIISSNLRLRHTNRIKSIQGSLAIEQNTLSFDQVTAVINGKHIIAPPKDVVEVKNAYEVYEKLDELNPYSADDLLFAHAVMTKGLVKESGMFRTGNVGVVDSNGRVLHVGTLSAYVPNLVLELLEWTKTSEVHMLIRSCVFHYELELIHPFADGNGRMGRLWNTLLLSTWNPQFKWLPVESIINDRQQQYYDAINMSNSLGESTPFIEFMLSAIKEAVIDTIKGDANTYFEKEDKKTARVKAVKKYLKTHAYIMNSDVMRLLRVSSATANRILSGMTEQGIISKTKIKGHWAYTLTKK